MSVWAPSILYVYWLLYKPLRIIDIIYISNYVWDNENKISIW
jgi:hypothetical protein